MARSIDLNGRGGRTRTHADFRRRFWRPEQSPLCDSPIYKEHGIDTVSTASVSTSGAFPLRIFCSFLFFQHIYYNIFFIKNQLRFSLSITSPKRLANYENLRCSSFTLPIPFYSAYRIPLAFKALIISLFISLLLNFLLYIYYNIIF